MLRKRQKNDLYCQFLIAAQRNYTVTELAERLDNHPAHDSITKWLENDHLTPKLLWQGLKKEIDVTSGDLILDHTVFDKWYSANMDLVYLQYSGTHHDLVDGIGLTTLLWYSHYQHLPIDYRLFDPNTDGKTRNDHTRDMLKVAHQRGFNPGHVVMDSEFASLDNLKLINSFGWKFVAWVKSNRQVSFFPHQHHAVSDIPIPKTGCLIHLKGFGVVKLIRLVRPHDIDYLITNDTELEASDILDVAARRWEIETYHRGLKQVTGVAKCQARTNRAQRNHLFCAIRVFLTLEKRIIQTGLSIYEQKKKVIEEAISLYLRGPTIALAQVG